jgi:signal transduction histidine kinase
MMLPGRLVVAGGITAAVLVVRRMRAGVVRHRLLGRAVRAAETERQAIASQLHDGSIQELAAIGLIVQRAARQLARGDSDGARLLLDKAARGLQAEIATLRAMMGTLRPQVLDALGLAGALRDEVDVFGRATGVEAGFSSAMPARVSPETELVLWRTAGLVLSALRRQAVDDGGPRPAGLHVSLAGHPGRAVLRVVIDGERGAALGERWPGLGLARDHITAAGGSWTSRARPGGGVAIEALGPSPLST